MKYYMNVFIVYSVLGYLLETTLKTFFIPNLCNENKLSVDFIPKT